MIFHLSIALCFKKSLHRVCFLQGPHCFCCGDGATQVGVEWSHYPKYGEIYTETRGVDVYIYLSLSES